MFVKIQMILMIKTSISNNRLSRLNKSKLYESVRKSLNRYIYSKKSKSSRFNLLLLTFFLLLFHQPSKFTCFSKLLYFNPGWNIFNTGWNFSYNCIFFNTVYRVEMSTRDESPYNRPLKFEQWAVSVCFVAWFWKMY